MPPCKKRKSSSVIHRCIHASSIHTTRKIWSANHLEESSKVFPCPNNDCDRQGKTDTTRGRCQCHDRAARGCQDATSVHIHLTSCKVAMRQWGEALWLLSRELLPCRPAAARLLAASHHPSTLIKESDWWIILFILVVLLPSLWPSRGVLSGSNKYPAHLNLHSGRAAKSSPRLLHLSLSLQQKRQWLRARFTRWWSAPRRRCCYWPSCRRAPPGSAWTRWGSSWRGRRTPLSSASSRGRSTRSTGRPTTPSTSATATAPARLLGAASTPPSPSSSSASPRPSSPRYNSIDSSLDRLLICFGLLEVEFKASFLPIKGEEFSWLPRFFFRVMIDRSSACQ